VVGRLKVEEELKERDSEHWAFYTRYDAITGLH
jgi:hypothetical protein